MVKKLTKEMLNSPVDIRKEIESMEQKSLEEDYNYIENAKLKSLGVPASFLGKSTLAASTPKAPKKIKEGWWKVEQNVYSTMMCNLWFNKGDCLKIEYSRYRFQNRYNIDRYNSQGSIISSSEWGEEVIYLEIIPHCVPCSDPSKSSITTLSTPQYYSVSMVNVQTLADIPFEDIQIGMRVYFNGAVNENSTSERHYVNEECYIVSATSNPAQIEASLLDGSYMCSINLSKFSLYPILVLSNPHGDTYEESGNTVEKDDHKKNSEWNCMCPKCGGRAYQGLSTITCENGCKP